MGNITSWIQIILYFGLVLLITKPLGLYICRVLDAEGKTFLDPVVKPFEKLTYKLCGVDPKSEQDWKQYTVSMLVFSGLTMAFAYLVFRFQDWMPLQSLLNPQKFPGWTGDLAFMQSASFVANTDWQSYTPEQVCTYFSSMFPIVFNNFASSAVGIAIAAAVVRGFARHSSTTLGNFWVDLTRVIAYLLLPVCTIFAIFLVSQGVIQNFKPYVAAAVVEPYTAQVPKTDDKGNPVLDAKGAQVMMDQKVDTQTIPMGPCASQTAIKMFGLNGDSFFNANAAHPLENPTPLSNFLQMLCIFAIPAGMVYYYARQVNNTAHGWAIWAAMGIVAVAGALILWWAEAAGNPIHTQLGVDPAFGNMEGKEVRFGIVNSALFANNTTAAACGAINCQHDSLTPIGGLIPVFNIHLGEIIFGGVGSGLYGMLVYVAVTLTILLSALTLIFIVVLMALKAYGYYSGVDFTIPVLVSLLVCLIPTTIGGLLSAIGIAGIDRLVQTNVLAMSGRAVEAAGDVDVLLLDKTGTITLGNRQAVEFIPAPGVTQQELAEAAQLSSLADETPEGRSIVVLAKERYGLRGVELHEMPHAEFVAFSAQTRMSGVDVNGTSFRKGAAGSIRTWVNGTGLPQEVEAEVDAIAGNGGTPLVVATKDKALGVVYLKDIVKGGLAERFERFRAIGIRTVMITGDNKLTAAAIAKEAGVDDFLAEAKPEDKLAYLRNEQAAGRMVAMTGDGTNDAPALAQADVGVAMNTGTQAAKEAGNMVDLDSNPTKLLEVVEIGKQLLITRGALTTFSVANDVAKYFAIIPAMLLGTFPAIAPLNVMHLQSPHSAILSAVIFNAIIIILLIPLALKGVKFRPLGAAKILQRNVLIYGVGGVIIPFIGIKAIDIIIAALRLA